MTILNERKKRRSPAALKWIIVLAVIIGLFYLLYSWGGEQPVEQIEEPIEISDIEQA